ncbi:MAG TPA: hypothetical protein VNB90_01440 [Cytophagaceae bacterium]|nr:hypothetical protein [Cytophagaceae bacterium]
MKKVLLSLLFTAIVALSANAQGLYVGAGAGYGFRAGSTVFGTEYKSDGSYHSVRSSYGIGFVPNICVGYILPNNFGFEVALGSTIGHKIVIKDDFGTTTGKTTLTATSFYVNPSFIVRANEELRVVPYAKIGMLFGGAMAKNTAHADHFSPATGALTSTDDTETKYKGHLLTGLTTAFGMDWMISPRFAVFGELTARVASWAPGSYTITNTHVPYAGGVAQPSTVTSVSGNYEKDIPANYTGTNAPKTVLPFSAVGFNVGVKLYLSK